MITTIIIIFSQLVAGMKSEKVTLEANLYETRHFKNQLELRKEQLEAENHDLVLRKEALQGDYYHKKVFNKDFKINRLIVFD
jgi:hypothetical protein